MAREIINVGTVANDGTGDTLRAAMGKCNGNFSELYPRVVSGSIVSGVVTVNLANASDVLVNLTLSANVDDVVYQNIPTVCRVQWRITQSGGPWLFPATAFPDGTTVDGLYYLYTDSTVTRLFWETANGGTTSFLQANAPVEGSMISPAAETVLDDLTVADMVNTLGGATSTGSGGLVRANGPALVTPALGTPASGTLTNCTGLPTAGMVDDAVTNVKLANMAASTIKGRITDSVGSPQDLTTTQARSMIEAAPAALVSIGSSTTLTKAAHQGKVLYCTAALSLTVNASTDFDALASCEIIAWGGTVTFVATATINRVSGKPLTLPQYARAVLTRSNTDDVYLLTGEMA